MRCHNVECIFGLGCPLRIINTSKQHHPCVRQPNSPSIPLKDLSHSSLASDVRRLLSSPVCVLPDSVFVSVIVDSVPFSELSGTGAKLLIAVGAVVSDWSRRQLRA